MDIPVGTALDMWRVNRCAGRAGSDWRQVLETLDEQKARARYAKERAQMRQGGVELLGLDGKQVAYNWAPRLRTRW